MRGRRSCWRAGPWRGSTPGARKARSSSPSRTRTGDVQLILWPHVFARHRRELGSRVLLVRGTVSRWDGTTNVIVSRVRPIDTRVPMPAAHDWR